MKREEGRKEPTEGRKEPKEGRKEEINGRTEGINRRTEGWKEEYRRNEGKKKGHERKDIGG